MLTDLQTSKCMHTFRLFDSNGDGHIDGDDFALIADRVAKLRGWAAGSAEHDRVHQAYAGAWQFAQGFADKDHNNEVSPAEWITTHDYEFSHPDVFQQVVMGTADLNFFGADIDGDGKWTMDEYLVYLRALAAPEDHAEEV